MGTLYGLDPDGPYERRVSRIGGQRGRGVGRAAIMPTGRQPGLGGRARQHGGQRFCVVLSQPSLDRAGVLQRRRRRGQLPPIDQTFRSTPDLPATAIDKPRPHHALRGETGGVARCGRSPRHPGFGRICERPPAVSLTMAVNGRSMASQWPVKSPASGRSPARGRRRTLRTPTGGAAPTAGPPRSRPPATAASPRQKACPPTESTAAGPCGQVPTARPPPAAPSR